MKGNRKANRKANRNRKGNTEGNKMRENRIEDRIKRILGLVLFIFVSVFAVGFIFSQGGGTSSGDSDRINFVVDDESLVAKELLGEHASRGLYKVVIDTFEEAGEWYAKMPSDQGFISPRRHIGFPLALKGDKDVKTVPEKVKNPPRYRGKDGKYSSEYYPPYKDERKYVLGVRVDFQRRGNNWFALYPYRPIKLSGLVKGFEVWVAGRQKDHTLSVMVDDAYGDTKIIPIGKLNFLGWRRLTVNVPDQVKQYDYRFSRERGLMFKGFFVTCNPIQSWGKYYMYLDNFTAEISRFWEEYQDQSDPVDNW